jgi:ankyrin repeat protein
MSKDLPPYPRFGECISTLAGALDINKTDSNVGRLAREGDFDWENLDAVIGDLLISGTVWVIGDSAREIISPWISMMRVEYTNLILDVPLDALGRSDVLPILVEEFFAPAAASLLHRAGARMPGPDIRDLLDGKRTPVAVTLQWLDGILNASVEQALFPESTGSDRVEQEKIRKWRNGVDIPSSQSIKLLCTRLARHSARTSSAAFWLLISSALSRLERPWGGALGSLMLPYALGQAVDMKAVTSRLTALVQCKGNAWPELAEPGRKLWSDLMRTSQKRSGDQARTRHEIEALETMARLCDLQGQTTYHYEWMKGRWNVLSGQYEKALPYYELAFNLASYRAGYQIKDLISEASCVAAFLGKRAFLKRLKHVGIALSLFRKPDASDVLGDWEVDQFAKQLPKRFPAQGRFIESEADLSMQPMPGMMFISTEEVASIKVDLKTPNRIRAVHFAGGDVRRWPQLQLFASFGMLDRVKALLEAGASVDDLDGSGGSALLCALQYATETRKREVLDLLLLQSHQTLTLNAATHRKRLTPLMCAIDLGLPDVVEALLAQGADVEKRALTEDQSPLYYLVTQLFCKVNPARMFETLTTKLFEEPDSMQQDTLRRFGVAGTFGSDTSALSLHADVALATAEHLVSRHVAQHTVANLIEIAALLLKAGAKPNAVHQYPVPGRTPLMLAAESDLPELFDLMIRNGGEPVQPDAMGQNCLQIAQAFKSRKILDYMQRTTH